MPRSSEGGDNPHPRCCGAFAMNALKAHVDEEDKMGWQITTQFGKKYRRVSRRYSRKPKQDHHQRVGPLLPRPLLQAAAGEGLQALGHSRGAALNPPPRSLCHGTDLGAHHRTTRVWPRT